jgi:hypothetical protein
MIDDVNCIFKEHCRTFHENRGLCVSCRYNRPWRPDHYKPLYALVGFKKEGGKKGSKRMLAARGVGGYIAIQNSVMGGEEKGE